MLTETKATVVVLAYNGAKFLEPCLRAVLGQGHACYEVIVVDNGSTDGSADLVARWFPQVRLIRNQTNLGFSAGNNVGLQAASGDVLVLLNQDTVVQPGWLAALVNAFEEPAVGLAGCKILYPDGHTIQHAGGYLVHPSAEARHYGIMEPDEGQHDQVREADYVTGAALAIRRPVLKQIGGLDEQFFPGYYEDVDLCFRARQAGYKILYWPLAVVHHLEGGSFNDKPYTKHYLQFRNRIRFVFKHFSPDHILHAFIPALAEGLLHGRPEQLHVLAIGSLDAMLIWPEVAPVDADRVTKLQIIQAFRELHDRAVQHERCLKALGVKEW